MDDLKRLLDGYTNPQKPKGFEQGVMKRVERGETRSSNPLLVPGLACISCGLVLTVMLRTGLAEITVEWLKMIGGLLQ